MSLPPLAAVGLLLPVNCGLVDTEAIAHIFNEVASVDITLLLGVMDLKAEPMPLVLFEVACVHLGVFVPSAEAVFHSILKHASIRVSIRPPVKPVSVIQTLPKHPFIAVASILTRNNGRYAFSVFKLF